MRKWWDEAAAEMNISRKASAPMTPLEQHLVLTPRRPFDHAEPVAAGRRWWTKVSPGHRSGGCATGIQIYRFRTDDGREASDTFSRVTHNGSRSLLRMSSGFVMSHDAVFVS